jgi:enoyl-CoA hydratase/carnithine racemase
VRRVDRIAVVTLEREEKLNALSTDLEGKLLGALEAPDVRESACVILTGSGRAFSSGADLGDVTEKDPAAVLAYYRTTGGVYERVADLPQPTVSAIFGYCLGGGFELALATDFRIADATAVFGLPEVELGILPSSGGTYRLVQLIGPARAKELILARPRFDAQEALRLGLVNEVTRAGQALERALELGASLCRLPSFAVSVVKQAIDSMPQSSRDTALLLERLAYALLAQTPEADAAASAFTAKRTPRRSDG